MFPTSLKMDRSEAEFTAKVFFFKSYSYVFPKLLKVAGVAQNISIPPEERLEKIKKFYFPVGRQIFANTTRRKEMSDDEIWARFYDISL